MTWLEFTNIEPSEATYKLSKFAGDDDAVETEWVDVATGAALSILSHRTFYRFDLLYCNPATGKIVDWTDRLGMSPEFDPRSELLDRRADRLNKIRVVVRSWLEASGGLVQADPTRRDFDWKPTVSFKGMPTSYGD